MKVNPNHYVRREFDRYANEYHEKRLDPKKSPFNYYIENPVMERILKPIVKGRKSLELGCGTGIFLKKVQSWGGEVDGVDISEKQIEIARRENPDAKFYVCDVDYLKTSFGKYDIVYSSLMLHYLDDLDKLFFNVARALKDFGRFVFSFHHPFSEIMDEVKVKNKVYNVPKNYFTTRRYRWGMIGMQLHSYHHTFEQITQSMKKHGFLIEEILEPQAPEDKISREITIPPFCVISSVFFRD